MFFLWNIFCQSFSVTVFFSLRQFYIIFIMKKITSHFTSSEILTISSSLRLLLKVWIWYRYQNKIEKHYHHDGEQKLSFYKQVYFKTSRLRKRNDILVMPLFYFLRRTKIYCKKQRTPICLFDKNHTQDHVKCYLHE